MPAHHVDDEGEGERQFAFTADFELAEAIAEIARELAIRPGELVRRVVGQVFMSRQFLHPNGGIQL